ncbi:hypothetical protein DFH11DRAFT_1210193 [Phellopilus nigrolimitatus]|nr:hypothetical protein DFH11DRAFT_1210193 [Phellopilus nigrolimitatus]
MFALMLSRSRVLLLCTSPSPSPSRQIQSDSPPRVPNAATLSSPQLPGAYMYMHVNDRPTGHSARTPAQIGAAGCAILGCTCMYVHTARLTYALYTYTGAAHTYMHMRSPGDPHPRPLPSQTRIARARSAAPGTDTASGRGTPAALQCSTRRTPCHLRFAFRSPYTHTHAALMASQAKSTGLGRLKHPRGTIHTSIHPFVLMCELRKHTYICIYPLRRHLSKRRSAARARARSGCSQSQPICTRLATHAHKRAKSPRDTHQRRRAGPVSVPPGGAARRSRAHTIPRLSRGRLSETPRDMFHRSVFCGRRGAPCELRPAAGQALEERALRERQLRRHGRLRARRRDALCEGKGRSAISVHVTSCNKKRKNTKVYWQLCVCMQARERQAGLGD